MTNAVSVLSSASRGVGVHVLSSFSARPSCGAQDATPGEFVQKAASNVPLTIYAPLGNSVERLLLIKVSLIRSDERVGYTQSGW